MPRGVPKAGTRAKGAGRPPLGPEPLRRRNLWLADSQMARLRELGGGTNASAGVRRLLAVLPPTVDIPPPPPVKLRED